MNEEKQNLILPTLSPDRKVPSKRPSLPRIVFTFTLGLSFGFTLATLILSPYSTLNGSNPGATGKVLYVQQEISYSSSGNFSKMIKEKLEVKLDLNSTFVHELLKSSEEVAARKLAQEVRILCLVSTDANSHNTRAVHVRDTWGRHCNNIHFISTKNDDGLPTTKVNIPLDKDAEWGKMEGGFNYINDVRLKDFDWVVKTDHETFIVVENLRSMLTAYSQSEPIYFELSYGVNDKPSGSNSASYVLSKEAVQRLVAEGYKGTKHADCSGKNKAVHIGQCFKALGLKQASTRDELNRRRCLPLNQENDLKDLQNLTGDWWKEDYVYWPMNAGLNCCSTEPISFHLAQSTALYMLEYLIYHVRPYSTIRHTRIQLPLEQFKDSPVTTPKVVSTSSSTTQKVTTTAATTTPTKVSSSSSSPATTASTSPSTTAKSVPSVASTVAATETKTAAGSQASTSKSGPVSNATTVATTSAAKGK